MTTKPTAPPSREAIDEGSAWLVGGGIVTMALFPLALPGIALAVIAALPLVLVGLVGALVAALFVLPVRLARRIPRGRRRRTPKGAVVEPVAAPVSLLATRAS